MLRNKLMTGVAVLVLLGAIAGCAVDLEQPPEAASTLERTVEETIVVSEQPAEEVDVDLEQPAGETATFTIQGWVTVDAYHYDEATGTYIHFYHDESSNLVVDIGKEWIEDQLGDSASATTDTAQYISLSLEVEATGTPAAEWLEIPNELNGVPGTGLDRALGAYLTTGTTGEWTISHTFTADETYTDVGLTGLQWDATKGSPNNLLAANRFTTAVTLNNGDSLAVTWTLTLS